MDKICEQIVKFTLKTTNKSIGEAAARAVIRNHFDAAGCAIAALDQQPCLSARQLAASIAVPSGASVFGLPERTSLEYATFANGVMIRCLDFNDTYHCVTGGGHASDAIPAIWAQAESIHANGAQVLEALFVTYEVFGALMESVATYERGWDYGIFLEVASAAGVGKLLGLDEGELANAVSMSITPNIPLGVARAGVLSNWKSCAGPQAAMSGLFAARLASNSMTGPSQPFEGKRGVWANVTGPFELTSLDRPPEGSSRSERTNLKLIPAEHFSLATVAEFIQLHNEGVAAHDIESITFGTHDVIKQFIGGGQNDHDEKWDPQSHETADHSLPYLVAVALVDGEITPASFHHDRIRDPKLRPLMNKMSVVVDPNVPSDWANDPLTIIDVKLRSGTSSKIEARFPKGHHNVPASTADLERKFTSNSEPFLSKAEQEAMMTNLWNLPELDDINELTKLFRLIPPKRRHD